MPSSTRKPLVISIRLTGARETLAAFRQFPKEASDELRKAAGEIADNMVGWIKAGAAADSRQSRFVAQTTKRMTDRVPVVQVGGTKSITDSQGHRAPAYKVLFGANFGSSRYPQFRAHRGKGQPDYFIWSNIEGHQAEIDRRWNEAADRTIAKWSEGGDQV